MSLRKKAVSGVIWTFSQQFSIQIINFAVQIILARLLTPEVFGLIAMLSVFIAIGQMLMDSGMTTSIIRTDQPDQLDYSTVFVTNLVMSCLIYLLVFVSAPAIANFYDQPDLKNILRIYSLTFVIRSLVAVHTAKLTKEMNFKLQMKLQVPSTIFGAGVGVWMAYSGYGVWSLVGLNLAQTIIFTIQNWIFIKWSPSFIFDKTRFRYHFNFGYKITLSGFLDTIYNNSYNIVIGKFFSPAIVGFYNQAETMRLFPVGQISSVMGKVTYPLFSQIKSDEQLKSAYRSTMKLVLFVVIPVMLILLIIAEEVFVFLFGLKWLPSVPYFQVLAIASIVRPISSYNLNILKVKGRSDLYLKVEVIKKVLGVIAIFIALPFGVMPLVISLTVVSYFFVMVNMIYCGKLIDYSVAQQLKDVVGLFIIGVVVAVLCFFLRAHLNTYIESNFLMMLIVSAVYVILYVLGVFLLDRNMLFILKKVIRK